MSVMMINLPEPITVSLQQRAAALQMSISDLIVKLLAEAVTKPLPVAVVATPSLIVDDFTDTTWAEIAWSDEETSNLALLSESALAIEWLRPEEEEAWHDLHTI